MRDNRLVGVEGALDTLHTMIDELSNSRDSRPLIVLDTLCTMLDEHLTIQKEMEQHAKMAEADRADG